MIFAGRLTLSIDKGLCVKIEGNTAETSAEHDIFCMIRITHAGIEAQCDAPIEGTPRAYAAALDGAAS